MPDNNQLADIPLGNTGGEFTYDRLVGILNYLVDTALLLGGLIAVAAVVYYGVQMSLAKAEPKKYTDAKEALIKAVIGAVLIFGVYTIINTISSAVSTLKN